MKAFSVLYLLALILLIRFLPCRFFLAKRSEGQSHDIPLRLTNKTLSSPDNATNNGTRECQRIVSLYTISEINCILSYHLYFEY